MLLALVFAGISLSVNYQYQNMFAQILEISKGLLQKTINLNQPQIVSYHFGRPFDKAVNRGKVVNYREVRTQNRDEISKDLKIDFPKHPSKYIQKRAKVSPYTPPTKDRQNFLLYKRLFTTLWNWWYSCNVDSCQRWDQTKGEHEGVDIVMPLGTPVKSISNWIVIEKNWGSSKYLGNYVVILTKFKNQYLAIYYGHLSSVNNSLRVGQTIEQGQIIGKVGNTGRSYGAHLHLQINTLGTDVNNTNLAKLLNRLRTDKSEDSIKKYTLDPLVLIEQNYQPDMQEQIGEVEQTIKQIQDTNLQQTSQGEAEQITQEEMESEAKAETETEAEAETEIETDTEVKTSAQDEVETNTTKTYEPKTAQQISKSNIILPPQPIAGKTYNIQISNAQGATLKIYDPSNNLQKIKITKPLISYTFEKAGTYHFSLYQNNKKITKQKTTAIPFVDYQNGQYKRAINTLYNKWIVKGSNHQLLPEQSLSRAELTTILMRSIYHWELDELKAQMQEDIKQNGKFFKDIQGDEWFAPWAYMAYKLGYIKGDDWYFMPNQQISRAQLITIYWRVFKKERFSQAKLWNDVSSDDRFFKYAVAARYDNLLFDKSKNFKPNQQVNRLEAFVTLYKYLNSQSSQLSFSLNQIKTALSY